MSPNANHAPKPSRLKTTSTKKHNAHVKSGSGGLSASSKQRKTSEGAPVASELPLATPSPATLPPRRPRTLPARYRDSDAAAPPGQLIHSAQDQSTDVVKTASPGPASNTNDGMDLDLGRPVRKSGEECKTRLSL